MNHVFVYESGLILLASWGAVLMGHEDDCERATQAALNIKAQLRRLQSDESAFDSFVEPPVHIGIATGDVYQCVVGD